MEDENVIVIGDDGICTKINNEVFDKVIRAACPIKRTNSEAFFNI